MTMMTTLMQVAMALWGWGGRGAAGVAAGRPDARLAGGCGAGAQTGSPLWALSQVRAPAVAAQTDAAVRAAAGMLPQRFLATMQTLALAGVSAKEVVTF